MALSIEVMIGVLGAWLDPKRLRPRLEAIPVAALLLPSIAHSYDALVIANQGLHGEATEEQLASLRRQEVEVDDLHDVLARGVSGVLVAIALVTADPAPVRALIQKLFPRGVSATIHQSYTAEAGNADALAHGLTAADHALLAQIVLPGGETLDHVVARWFEQARRLGALEAERGALETARGTQKTQRASLGSHGNLTKARGEFSAVVRALRGVLGLAGSADPAVVTAIFRDLDRAEGNSGPSTQPAAPSSSPAAPAAGLATPPAAPAAPTAPAPPAAETTGGKTTPEAKPAKARPAGKSASKHAGKKRR
jgi:hypothetical protein